MTRSRIFLYLLQFLYCFVIHRHVNITQLVLGNTKILWIEFITHFLYLLVKQSLLRWESPVGKHLFVKAIDNIIIDFLHVFMYVVKGLAWVIDVTFFISKHIILIVLFTLNTYSRTSPIQSYLSVFLQFLEDFVLEFSKSFFHTTII